VDQVVDERRNMTEKKKVLVGVFRAADDQLEAEPGKPSKTSMSIVDKMIAQMEAAAAAEEASSKSPEKID
jgi:hypothetical protein